MKTRALLCLLLPLVSAAWAETRAQGSTSEEATVRALDNQTRIAALNRDVAALERLWSEHLTVNAPDNRVVVGRRAVLDGYLRTGVINFSSFERQIEFLRVDGDFAILMGGETVRPITDAPTSGLVAGETVHRRFTHIWKKEAGTWRLFARHANVIPSR